MAAIDDRPRWVTTFVWVTVCAPLIAITLTGISGSLYISWIDVATFLLLYSLSMLGLTVGFHRLFSHRSFRACRWLKISLGILGSIALEGPITVWVCNHRRHHAHADREGDPHSPWRFGTTPWALCKGLVHAHVGWLFDGVRSDNDQFGRDLLTDPDVTLIGRLFVPIALAGLVLPSTVALLISSNWKIALGLFIWGGLIRVFMVHHVSWSVNSVCHVFGTRPHVTADHSTNFWPLALASMGEAWHNEHHARPRLARHGRRPGELDPSAAAIRLLERCGWATDVKWAHGVNDPVPSGH